MRKAILILLATLSVTYLEAQQNGTFDEEKAILQYQQQMVAGETKQAFETLVSWYYNTNKLYPAMLVAEALQTGTGTEVNMETALALYKAVADTPAPDGDENSKLIIATCCRQYGTLKMVGEEQLTPEGKAYLQRAITLTDDAMALTLLGMLTIDDRKEEGLGYLRRAAERNSIIALELLGEEAASREDMDQAMVYWEKAATTPIYDIAREERRNADLSFLANPNLSTNPTIVEYQRDACYHLADTYFDMEDTKTALTWLDKIVQENDESLILRSYCYFQTDGREGEAIQLLKDIYDQRHNPEVLVHLGILYHYNGQDTVSMTYLEKAKSEGCASASAVYNEFFNH